MDNLKYNLQIDVQVLARLELLRRLFGLSDYDAVLQMALHDFYQKMKGKVINAELKGK